MCIRDRYNTGGYDSLEMLKLLDGVVDIYMPDMKYGDETFARKYSRIKDYPKVNQEAVAEMHRQVGDLVLDDNGIALRGLLDVSYTHLDVYKRQAPGIAKLPT